MKRSENFSEFTKAYFKLQAEVKNLVADKDNPYYGSKYYTLDKILDYGREIFAKYGFILIQTAETGIAEKEVLIHNLLIHESGEYLETSCSFPAYQQTKEGIRFTPQTVGIAITYGRRYTLSPLLGIASETDDDANELEGDFSNTDDFLSPPTRPTEDYFIKIIGELNNNKNIPETNKPKILEKAKLNRDNQAILKKIWEEIR